MADIKRLALSAREKLANRTAVNEADAIRKAIIGSGVRHEPDVRRLMSQVGRQIYRDKRPARSVRR